MSVGKAMLGGLIVAFIYVGSIISIMSPYVFAIGLYHAHAIAAVVIIVSWTFYILAIGYIFSAYKLLDIRWTVSWIERILK